MTNRHQQPARLLAVSDIHGHGEGLLRLLAQAEYIAGQDQLILLGDYINADPSTWGTLKLIHELAMEGAIVLPGNLEVNLLRRSDGLPERYLSAELLSWLRGLPYYTVMNRWLFVHAGVRPGVPLTQQSAEDLTGIRESFWSAPPEKGPTVVFGHTPTFKLGAEPGRLWQADGRLGIDTGAKHGYRLTLLDLNGGLAYSCSTAPFHLYDDIRTHPFHLQ